MRKLTYTIVISDDEAMVSHLSGFKQTIVFAPRHDRVSAKVIKLGGNELRGAVGTLRRGLDLTVLNRLPRSIRRKPLRSTGEPGRAEVPGPVPRCGGRLSSGGT